LQIYWDVIPHVYRPPLNARFNEAQRSLKPFCQFESPPTASRIRSNDIDQVCRLSLKASPEVTDQAFKFCEILSQFHR
jgi:hypothetical protein